MSPVHFVLIFAYVRSVGGSALQSSMRKGTKSVRRWFRILAVVIVCFTLAYTVAEALDTSAITDGSTEFAILAQLMVIGVMVTLILLVLFAFQMLIEGSVDLIDECLNMQCCRRTICVVHPPGPLAVPLRI